MMYPCQQAEAQPGAGNIPDQQAELQMGETQGYSAPACRQPEDPLSESPACSHRNTAGTDTRQELQARQERRRKWERICLSAQIVYGKGLFCTISPSERHGGLAIQLSRYGVDDPLLRAPTAEAERRWIGQDNPSLQANMDDGTTVELPEYDRRRRNSACIIDITAAP